jgi:hypothetical protein
VLARWAEMNVIMADKFRVGNVPALQEPLGMARRVTQYYLRGDSTCYDKNLMTWLRKRAPEDFPRGPIRFAISVRMEASLKERLLQLPFSACKPYREARSGNQCDRRIELFGRTSKEKTVRVPAFCGDPDKETARRVDFRRRGSQARQRGRQRVGLGSTVSAGVP